MNQSTLVSRLHQLQPRSSAATTLLRLCTNKHNYTESWPSVNSASLDWSACYITAFCSLDFTARKLNVSSFLSTYPHIHWIQLNLLHFTCILHFSIWKIVIGWSSISFRSHLLKSDQLKCPQTLRTTSRRYALIFLTHESVRFPSVLCGQRKTANTLHRNKSDSLVPHPSFCSADH